MNNWFKKRKWNEEQEQWLIDHKDIRGKKAMYEAFMAAFPEATFTPEAISSKRTELGAFGTHEDWRYRNARPLYSEQIKKGYVRIKVSKCEWWQKSKWVWVSTHPGEAFDRKDQFLYLDKNPRNFNWKNIRKVTCRVIGVINRAYGGLPSNDPEVNDIFITRIELKLAALDLGEKFGLVANYGEGRAFRSERNEYAKKRRQRLVATSEEFREKERKYSRERSRILRADPVWRQKEREYQREWARRKRENAARNE